MTNMTIIPVITAILVLFAKKSIAFNAPRVSLSKYYGVVGESSNGNADLKGNMAMLSPQLQFRCAMSPTGKDAHMGHMSASDSQKRFSQIQRRGRIILSMYFYVYVYVCICRCLCISVYVCILVCICLCKDASVFTILNVLSYSIWLYSMVHDS